MISLRSLRVLLPLSILFGVCLRADPVALLPGDGQWGELVGPLGGTVVFSDTQAFTPTGPLVGEVGVTVLSGANPYNGGLTFVYEVKNTSTSGTEGIGNFRVSGWAGFDVVIATGDNPYFSPPGGPLVVPGAFLRSLDGDTIDFTFPPDIIAPPIFAGENGMQLILFTNATAWTGTTGSIVLDDFTTDRVIISDTNRSIQVGTVTGATSVPDSGNMAILVGFAFLMLFVAAPRLQAVVR